MTAQHLPAFVLAFLTAVSAPLQLVDNRVFVSVHVGTPVARMVVDTGGSDALDTAFAKANGISAKFAGSATGAGETRVAMGKAQVRFTLDGVTTPLRTVDVMDLSPIANALKLNPFDGIIGYEELRDGVTTIDYETSTIRFNDRWPAGSTSIPFTLYGTIPLIHATIDGVEGRFLIDTGDRSAVTLYETFARKHGFFARPDLQNHVITGWGLGGPIHSALFRASSVRVGTHEVRGVVARISLQKSGAFAVTDVDGSIGGALLKHFAVSFDYVHDRIALRDVPVASESCEDARAPLSQECQYERHAASP